MMFLSVSNVFFWVRYQWNRVAFLVRLMRGLAIFE